LAEGGAVRVDEPGPAGGGVDSANIAEGYARQSRASYTNFLTIARGSLKELETHLLLAERIRLSKSEMTAPLLTLSDDLGRMLGGLIRKLSPD